MDALKDVYQDLRWEESLLVAGCIGNVGVVAFVVYFNKSK